MEFDRHGWVVNPREPLPIGRSYTLLSPEASSRMDIAFWAHKARTFFKTSIELGQAKAYPNGQGPDQDAVWVDVLREHPKKAERPTRVLLLTFPLEIAPALRQAGEQGAAAIGGAGMDALVARAKRAWQIDNEVAEGGDPQTPLLLAAILASIFLAPIVPVGGGTIFGVKGARERLGLS